MTFKSKLLRRRAQPVDAPEACPEEPNAIEKFLNDASSAVTNAFPEAADDLSSQACSTITDPSGSFTYSYTSDTETETDIDTRAGEADAMKIFLKKASGAVGSALEEASSMAGDMHTIVMADIDEESASKEQDKLKSATEPVTTSFMNTIKLKKNRVSKTVKDIGTCETLEEEKNTEQPTSPNTEVKGNHTILAKLMNKLKNQIEKIKQQINKTEEEVVETK